MAVRGTNNMVAIHQIVKYSKNCKYQSHESKKKHTILKQKRPPSTTDNKHKITAKVSKTWQHYFDLSSRVHQFSSEFVIGVLAHKTIAPLANYSGCAKFVTNQLSDAGGFVTAD